MEEASEQFITVTDDRATPDFNVRLGNLPDFFTVKNKWREAVAQV